MKRKFLLLFLTIYMHCLYGQQRSSEGNFEYSSTACKPKINLDIYNGLYGDFGGQKVTKKTKNGAVTVANLNDTDSDSIPDLNDPEVLQSDHGTNEIDLMKLVIDKVGVYTDLTKEVELVIVGNIEIYDDDSKKTKAIKKFPISALPKTVYIEARAVSTGVRDISIKAMLEGIEEDEVKATAIWVNFKKKYMTRATSGVNNPTPSSLGIDQIGLLNAIDDTYIASDGSRYGVGTNSKFDKHEYSNPNCNENLYTGLDGAFGGKVLFEFEIFPNDITKTLYQFDIYFDVTRQIQEEVYVLKETNPVFTLDKVKPRPKLDEQANDEGVSGDKDEDNTPLNKEIFSFDNPSHNYVIGGYFAPPYAFIKRKFDAWEFVRVSFNKNLTSKDGIEGSRCSLKEPWGINYGLVKKPLVSSTYLFDPCESYYAEYKLTSEVSQLKKLGAPLSKSDGIFTITSLANPITCTYILKFLGSKWELSRKTSNALTVVGVFPVSQGSCDIEDIDKLKINIKDNTQKPFQIGEQLIFLISNETITTKIY